MAPDTLPLSGPAPAPAPRGPGLVIFDCDGVLVDSEIVSCGTVARMFERHGVRCDLATAVARYLGRPASAVTEDFVRLAGRPLPPRFVEEWRAELFGAFARDLAAVPGARATVESLAAHALDYCLASSSDEERIGIALRKAGLFDLFEGRIFSGTRVARSKPAPDLFLLAAGTLGVPPRRCTVVEDSVVGVEAARAAGMNVIGFTAGSHHGPASAQPLLDAGAWCVAASMPELQRRLARLSVAPAASAP